MNDSRVIVALDFADAKTALALAQRLDPQSCRVKVGKELFTAAGPQLVEKLVALGHAVFLDLKYHDIPNTVAGACRAAAALGVWMLNVHALGGRAMLEAARGALAPGPQTPRLIAVTLLTSMAQRDLAEVGLAGEPQTTVERLARLAQNCGLDGVVCSAQEVERLRAVLGGDFLLVTPGIRYSAAAADDQQRIMTPQAALAAGSDYLVVGRPVTQAADPASVVDDINRIALGMKRA